MKEIHMDLSERNSADFLQTLWVYSPLEDSTSSTRKLSKKHPLVFLWGYHCTGKLKYLTRYSTQHLLFSFPWKLGSQLPPLRCPTCHRSTRCYRRFWLFQPHLKFMFLLLLAPECWDYKCLPHNCPISLS